MLKDAVSQINLHGTKYITATCWICLRHACAFVWFLPVCRMSAWRLWGQKWELCNNWRKSPWRLRAWYPADFTGWLDFHASAYPGTSQDTWKHKSFYVRSKILFRKVLMQLYLTFQILINTRNSALHNWIKQFFCAKFLLNNLQITPFYSFTFSTV